MVSQGIIYLIQNQLNGKQYIGQTTQCLRARFGAHLSLAKNPSSKSHSVLHRAIAKHGEKNFVVSMVCHGAPGEELDGMEAMFIEMYDTASPKGYNIYIGAPGQAGVRTVGYKRKDMSLPKNIYTSRNGYLALHPPSGKSYTIVSQRFTMEEKLQRAVDWLAEAEKGNITKPERTRVKYDLPKWVNWRSYGNIKNRYYSSKPGLPVRWFLTLEETVAYVGSE